MKTSATCPARPWRPGRAWTRGQALVEFSLAGVAFLMLLFGIMELAMAVLAYNSISFAASEAARYGAALPTSSQNAGTGAPLVIAVAQNAAPSVNLQTSNVTVTWPGDTLLPGRNDIKVTVTYNYPISIPFTTATTLSLSSTSQMMCSQ